MTNSPRRLRAGLLALSLSAAFALPAFPQLAHAASGVEIAYQQFTLANGLRVIVHEDHKAPIVAVNLWYRVGSKDEKPGKTGFAHLYEHLMFEGSENRKGKFFAPFEKAGATDQNGTTNTDRTNFFENVPTTALDMALWMESDRMGHLLGGVDQATLDQQRGVVQNEKRGNENQPYGHARAALQEAMYPVAHPYHHTTIGSMADLDGASLEDVKNWFRTWYGPNNAVLVLAGDIDLATAKAKVARYFGDIPASPTIPMPKAWVAGREKSTRATMTDRVAQALMIRSWNVPEYGNPDVERLQLFAQVLGGSRSSRLSKRLVHQEKLADQVNASVSSSQLAGTFSISAVIKQGVDPAKVEAIVDEELRTLLRDGPTAAEIERARTVFRAGFIRGIERIGGFGGKADVLAECAVFTGNPGCFRESLKTLDSATPWQIKTTANRWLARGDHTLVVVPGALPPTIADLSTANEPYATKTRATPVIDPEFKVTASDLDRSKGVPEVDRFPALKFPTLQRATLTNGMKVVLAERHEIPVVQMTLQIGGGFEADVGHKLGTASFTMGMLDQGAGSYDALALADREESLGASIGSGADLDEGNASLSALTERLDESLALYADVILRPTFAPAEIDRVRQTWLAGIAQEKTQPTALALRVLPPLLFGDGHPYAIPLSGTGTEASISSLTREDLVAFHRQWVRPDNATLIIVGDATLKGILPLLEKHFGDWKTPTEPLPPLSIPTVVLPVAPRVLLVDQPGAIQANILVGQVTPSSMEIQRALEFNIANEILGGPFTSRLNSNLREGKHWAYGSSSSASSAKGQRTWIAYAAVQIDKTAESMLEMRREISEFANGKAPPTEAEILHAKANTVRSMPGDYETASGVMGSIGNIVRYNRPDDYIQTFKSRIDAMPAAAVRNAAGVLVPTGLTWVVVGDLSKIEAPVRALNIGEVTVVDADGKPDAAKPMLPAPKPMATPDGH
ncbi:MAG: pitrilysin family protein [Lysobacteraceae bacterium]